MKNDVNGKGVKSNITSDRDTSKQKENNLQTLHKQDIIGKYDGISKNKMTLKNNQNNLSKTTLNSILNLNEHYKNVKLKKFEIVKSFH